MNLSAMISLSVSRVAICKLVCWHHGDGAKDMTVDSGEEMKCLRATHEINLWKSDSVAREDLFFFPETTHLFLC